MSGTPILLLLLSSVALVLMSLLYVHSQMQSNEHNIAEMNAAISDLARQLSHERDVSRKARARTASAVAAAAKSSSKSHEAMNLRHLKLSRERDVAAELVRVGEAQRNEAVSAARRAENAARDVKRQMREHLQRLNDWSNTATLLANARANAIDDFHRDRESSDLFDDLDTIDPMEDVAPATVIRIPPPPVPTAAGRRVFGSVVTRAPAVVPTTPAVVPATPAPFMIVVAFSLEHDDGELAARHINGLLTELSATHSPLLVYVRNHRLDERWSAQFRDKKELTIIHKAKDRVPASALLTDAATPDEQTATIHLEQLLGRAAGFGADFVLLTTDRATMCDRAWSSILKSIALVQKLAKNGWGSVRFGAGLDGLLIHRIALQQLISFLIRYGKMASTEELVSQWIHGSWPGAMMHVDAAPRSPITPVEFAHVNKTQPSTSQRHLLHFHELTAKFQSVTPVVPCMAPLVKHINPLEVAPDKTTPSCMRETIRPCW